MELSAIKTVPEIRVSVWTRAGIPYLARGGNVVVNVFRDQMALAQGDGGERTQINGEAWKGNPKSAFKDISAYVEFIRFCKDGSVIEGASAQEGVPGEVAGMTLKPREVARLAHVNGTTAGGSGTPLKWKSVTGTHMGVQLPGNVSAIVNTGSSQEEIAQTNDQLPANQGAKVSLLFSRKSSAGVPVAVVAWGGNAYRVVLTHDAPPRVEKQVNGSWVILRRMKAVCNLMGGTHTVQWLRRGGRLTVKFDDRLEHFLELTDSGEAMITTWPAGGITVQSFLCRVRADVSLLAYTDGTNAMTGTYTLAQNKVSYSSEDDEVAVVDAGYRPTPDSIKTTQGFVGDEFQQTTTLTATSDGIDAPLHTAGIMQYPLRTTTSEAIGVDIAAAVMSAQLSQAMPPIMPGAELRLEIDRVLLDGIFGDINWQPYLDSYCPITFESRWHYSDGTIGLWIKYFTGYIFQKEVSTAEVADGKLSITCRDPIVRLQNPASMIDYRYPPLDFLFGKKANDHIAGGAQSLSAMGLWGVECVHEILRIALGSVEAFALNNAGGDLSFLLRYFPREEGTGMTTHYPLLNMTNGASYAAVEMMSGTPPPDKDSFWFPPPYGDDALSWINQIATKDHAVFFYGQPDGYNGAFPTPVYGRITEIIRARNVLHHIPDAIYHKNSPGNNVADWDANQALQSAQWGSRPENEINRWMVLANGPFGDAKTALLPAYRIAVAQTEAPDPNAPEYTWERTQIIRDELAWFPGAAEGYAMLTRDLLKGVLYRWPSFTCQGRDYGADADPETRPGIDPVERPINWGDKVVLRMNDPDFSDKSIELNGNTYRVEHVEQEWTFDANPSHTMQVWVRPLTAEGV